MYPNPLTTLAAYYMKFERDLKAQQPTRQETQRCQIHSEARTASQPLRIYQHEEAGEGNCDEQPSPIFARPVRHECCQEITS